MERKNGERDRIKVFVGQRFIYASPYSFTLYRQQHLHAREKKNWGGNHKPTLVYRLLVWSYAVDRNIMHRIELHKIYTQHTYAVCTNTFSFQMSFMNKIRVNSLIIHLKAHPLTRIRCFNQSWSFLW